MATLQIESWADIRELVKMSIGTDKGTWWADPGFGSDLWKLNQAGKVDSNTVGYFIQYVLDCLQWLKDDGIAEDVLCTARQEGKTMIAYSVTVLRAKSTPVYLEDIYNVAV